MIALGERETAERVNGEQNSFLGFVDKNKDLFGKYSSLTYELRDEEKSWRNSPAIDDFAERNFELTLSLVPYSKPDNNKMRKAREKTRDVITDTIFKQKEGEKPIHLGYSVLSRLTPKMQALAETLDKDIGEFRTGFRETKKPIVDALAETKVGLTEKFRDFFLSDPSGIFMFQEFLLSKESRRTKEEIRPFLSSLFEEEEHMHKKGEDGIFSQAVKKWTSEFKEHPTDDLLDEFVPLIKEPVVLGWLKFMFPMPIRSTASSQGEDEWRKNVANYLKNCPISTWPPDLKSLLISFVGSKYQLASVAVRRELGQFRRPVSLRQINQRFGDLEKEIETMEVKVTFPKKTDNKKPAPALQRTEKGEGEKHPVGILSREIGRPYSVRVSTKDELEEFLRKESESLDSSDPRMLEDLKKIVMSLRENPQGYGTTILHSAGSITVDNSHTWFRSLNPRLRHLDLAHPKAYEVRIVFAISGNNDTSNGNNLSVIGIRRICNHDDYLKEFRP